MSEILKYLGISGGIVFIIIIIVFNADKIYLLLSILVKPFYFLKFVRKAQIAFEFQGKINDICGKIASNIFDRKLKIGRGYFIICLRVAIRNTLTIFTNL